jgi:[ribosomal protein S5]-alanine N-acetyltransferase
MARQLIDPESALRVGNLVLEPIVRAHAVALFDALQAPELYTFIPHDSPKSVEALQARYERWAERRSPDETEIWLNYAVFSPADDAYLGTVQATCMSSGKAYLAYDVFPLYWRRGVARAACSVLISHLFSAYKVDIVSAQVDTRNEASWRLLEALGFKRNGTIKNADHFKGKPSDEYVYEIKRSEWNGPKKLS